MILNTLLSQAVSALAGKPPHTATRSAFSNAQQAPGRSATLSREEFRQAALEVLG